MARKVPSRLGPSLVTLLLGLAAVSAVAGPPADERDPDPRVVINGVRQTDLRAIPYSIDGAALNLRRAAANGIGAPQIGLNPRWPQKERANWQAARIKYPSWVSPFEPCVEKFELAILEIQRIAPLTRRPTFDTAVDEINAGLRQARNLLGVGDRCMEEARKDFGRMAAAAKAENDRKVLQGRAEYDAEQNRPDADHQRDPRIPEASPPADPGPKWPGGIDPAVAPVRVPGGYDPCANPRPPPQCALPAAPVAAGNASPRASPQQGGDSSSSGNGAPPNTVPSSCWPKAPVRDQAVDALRSLGEVFANRRSNLSLSDEFTFHLAAGVRAGFEQLSQKLVDGLAKPRLLPTPLSPSVDPELLAPAVRDVVRYLQDNPSPAKVTADLLHKADEGLQRMRDEVVADPGFFIGKQMPEAFVGECLPVAPTPGNTRLIAQASQDVGALSRAAAKVKTIDDGFREFVGTSAAEERSLRELRTRLGLPAPRYNPEYGQRNCQHCVTAALHEWETGEHTTAPDVGPLSRAEIVDDLRRRYGEARPAPEGLAPDLRQQWHAGVPIKVPGPGSVRGIFDEGGVGSAGYVYYRRAVVTESNAAGQPTRYGLEGHVVGIFHGESGVRIHDPQAGEHDVWEMVSRDMELYGAAYYPVRLGKAH